MATIVAIGLALCFCAPAWSQQKSDKPKRPDPPSGVKATARTHPNHPMLWDVDAMMDEAVKQISRRYNLNPQQEEYTRLLLTQRVRSFLEEHETEVRELLQESMDMRTGVRANDATAKMVWASRALPLYEKAAQAILDGNKEWGEILDDEQKVIHEKDLKLMDTNFKAVTRTLTVWKDGKDPSTGTLVGNKGAVDGQDPRTSTGGSPVVIENTEDHWMSYVSLFIQAYGLDEKAKNSAREKIHKEQYAKARQYRELKKDQFAALKRMRAEADKKDETDPRKKFERLSKIADEQHELERPIREMFVEMDRRLKALPSREQEANVPGPMKKQLESYYRKLSGEEDKPGKQTEGDKGAVAAKETSPAGDADKPVDASKKDAGASGTPTGDTPPKVAGDTADKPTTDKEKKPTDAGEKPAEPAKPSDKSDKDDADDSSSDIPPADKPSNQAA